MPVPPVFAGLGDVFVSALGQAVTLTLGGETVREVTAIFRNPTEFSLEISQPAPQIALRAVDASGLVDGDLVTIDGAEYRIRTLNPDGKGMVDVILEAETS